MTHTEIEQRFMKITSNLSPENLHCDGEISVTEARARYRAIMKEWKSLEKEYGREVSEDEVWDWMIARRR